MKTPLLTLTAIAVALASPALALEKPMPGKSDSRVRFVDYNASDVVDLWTTPGAILTIEFADDETIAGVAVSDSHVLHSDKRKNFLILKPEGCLVPEPIVVLTNLPNGQLRRYTMQIETKPQVCGEQKPVITASATTGDPPPVVAEAVTGFCRRMRAGLDLHRVAPQLAVRQIGQYDDRLRTTSSSGFRIRKFLRLSVQHMAVGDRDTGDRLVVGELDRRSRTRGRPQVDDIGRIVIDVANAVVLLPATGFSSAKAGDARATTIAGKKRRFMGCLRRRYIWSRQCRRDRPRRGQRPAAVC